MAAGIIDILLYDTTQLINPLISFLLVGSNQGMHGKHIHFIVMRLAALSPHPVPEIFVVNNVISPYQAGKVKGLAGSINSNGPVLCIFAYALGRYVPVAV